MTKSIRERLREDVKPVHDETREYMQANYGSTANFLMRGALSVFKWVVLICGAFLAAILNLARKS